MVRLYDPISQTVFEKEDFPEPSSLQGLCRKSIIQAVTLGDIEKVYLTTWLIVENGGKNAPLPLKKPKNPTKIVLSVIVIFLSRFILFNHAHIITR